MHELENIETYSYMNICKKHDPTSYVKSVCGKCDNELQQRIKELEAKVIEDTKKRLEYAQRIAELEADRNNWKELYNDLHKLHTDGKLDRTEELIEELKLVQYNLKMSIECEKEFKQRIAELENITGVDFKFVDYEDYKKMMQERDRLKEAINKLANIANDLAICGPFENHKFVGCKLYQSDDPMEICLRCEILSLQQTIKEK